MTSLVFLTVVAVLSAGRETSSFMSKQELGAVCTRYHATNCEIRRKPVYGLDHGGSENLLEEWSVWGRPKNSTKSND